MANRLIYCRLFGLGALFCSAIGARVAGAELGFPPELPGGAGVVTDSAGEFLKAPAPLLAGVEIAKTPPTIDFLYYPEQSYPGNPWSVWGDSLASGG